METSSIITRPAAAEYPEYFGRYIGLVPSDNLLELLQTSRDDLTQLIQRLDEEKLNYRYQPGKWTIKEMLSHLVDSERIFAYRALRFARKDPTELPGFDENLFAENARAQQRAIQAIVDEYSAVRQASIELFQSFDEEMLQQTGLASHNRISVRALGYTIVGHERHHLNIIHERYLAAGQ